jgi:ABC-type multidrug transport system permease subunit
MAELVINSSIESYWDKETGVLCELGMSISGEILGESLSMSLAFLLTNTNVWTAPTGLLGIEWPIWIIAIAAITFGTIGVIVFRRR